ncbi:MAG: ABC transporter permease [Clostridiales bacterium]|nr:ABC transporter permease [Clostridiales bacterium]
MKKLTVSGIAKSNLKTRKRQYASLIFAIILAMVFSSGILLFVSSARATSNEEYYSKFGEQDFIVADSKQVIEQYNEYDFFKACVQNYFTATIIGTATAGDADFYVAEFDEGAREISRMNFLYGRYPENENEIAMEENTLLSFGLSEDDLNKAITFSYYVQNGTSCLDTCVEKEYTLVGIAANKVTNINGKYDSGGLIASVFVSAGTGIAPGGQEAMCEYINFTSDINLENYYDLIDAAFEQKAIAEYPECNTAIGTSAEYYWEFSGSMFAFAEVLAGMLLFTSCIAIVNSFINHLNNRKNQIGILRTVGATRRQIINIYGRETLIITLISAPAGVGISYCLTKLVLPLIYDDAVIKLKISTLVLCAAVGIATVMLASLIPLVKFSALTPIQSIRNIEANRKVKTKKIKSQKQFNISTLLAKRSLTMDLPRRAAVSIIIVITIVMSNLGFGYFSAISAQLARYDSLPDYQISAANYNYLSDSAFYNYNDKQLITENDIHEIEALNYVGKVYTASATRAVIINAETNPYLEALSYTDIYSFDKLGNVQGNTTGYVSMKNTFGIENPYTSDLSIINRASAEELGNNLDEGELDMAAFMSGSEVILYLPRQAVVEKVTYTDSGGSDVYMEVSDCGSENGGNYTYDEVMQEACNINVGDSLELNMVYLDSAPETDGEAPAGLEAAQLFTRTVTVAGIVFTESESYGMGEPSVESNACTVVASPNVFSEDAYEYCIETVVIKLDRACTQEIDDLLMPQLQNIVRNKVSDDNVRSIYQEKMSEYQATIQTAVVAVGILAIFIAVSVSIINNSLGERIRAGKKEIGTLRAMGADSNEISKMYIKQLLSIFAWSYGIGLGASIVFNAVMFILAKAGIVSENNTFRIWQTVIICILLFCICAFNLWLKIKKESKNSIIDNIRETE